MKKKWLIFGIGILAIVVFSAFYFVKKYNDNLPKKLPNGAVVYDFGEQVQLKARKILYNYLLEELTDHTYSYKGDPIDFTKNPKEAESLFHLTEYQVAAFEYDLNNDGEPEIIGYSWVSFYLCAQGYELYILQKQGDKYKRLFDKKYSFFIDPVFKFYILNQENNGYKNILYRSSYLYDYPVNLVKYGKNGYIYSKFLK